MNSPWLRHGLQDVCIAFVTCCNEIHLALAKLGVTISANSACSFEAKDAFENEDVTRPGTQPG